MSLLSSANLNEHEIQTLTDVVSYWCTDHRVEIESEAGRAAMAVAVGKLLSGAASPVTLSEAINQAMTNRTTR